MTDDEPFDLANRAVLIAEDEAIIALMAENVIEELGGRVIAIAHTCDQALSILSDTRPDLILLDVNLKGGTSERVVDVAIERGIPVLVSTGSGEKFIPDSFKGLPLLAKPWNFGAMSRALAATLVDEHSANTAYDGGDTSGK